MNEESPLKMRKRTFSPLFIQFMKDNEPKNIFYLAMKTSKQLLLQIYSLKERNMYFAYFPGCDC